eukprot:TRINITY_DN989_c1_g1_i2.p2 TRINITY_DN989_c1_g1~~TRINITY_DN989_c1_g1_i2.p2  ORF type:complete len:132 (+),score=0.96 TRINITY_DN989_c1_g1_i2:74-469(+)
MSRLKCLCSSLNLLSKTGTRDQVHKALFQQIRQQSEGRTLRVEEQPLQRDKESHGIKLSDNHVGLVIVLNPTNNYRAIREAYKLNIPIVALVDSDIDREYLSMITYPVYVNNAGLRFVYMFLRMVALVAKK